MTQKRRWRGIEWPRPSGHGSQKENSSEPEVATFHVMAEPYAGPSGLGSLNDPYSSSCWFGEPVSGSADLNQREARKSLLARLAIKQERASLAPADEDVCALSVLASYQIESVSSWSASRLAVTSAAANSFARQMTKVEMSKATVQAAPPSMP